MNGGLQRSIRALVLPGTCHLGAGVGCLQDMDKVPHCHVSAWLKHNVCVIITWVQLLLQAKPKFDRLFRPFAEALKKKKKKKNSLKTNKKKHAEQLSCWPSWNMNVDMKRLYLQSPWRLFSPPWWSSATPKDWVKKKINTHLQQLLLAPECIFVAGRRNFKYMGWSGAESAPVRFCPCDFWKW